MINEFSLDGKVALITGAGRGIGKAIALTMAEAGADIIAVDLGIEQIGTTPDEVKKLGRACLAIPTNVTKASDVDAMVKQALARFKRIDILVNNVGTVLIRPLVPPPGGVPPSADIDGFGSPTTEQDWHRVMDTNMTSIFMCMRAIGPHMMERKYGKIISMSSLAGQRGRIYRAIYGASKAAVSHFTRCMALEWARYNININAIAPGLIYTPMSQRIKDDKELRDRELKTIPLRRGAEPREVGLLAVYLASEASSFMTGQTICLDGGQTI